MEVLQGTTTKNRNADFLDALANGIGAIIGIAFAYVIVKSKKN
jgi:glycopeptide antibiotics resistance protein